MAKIAFGAVVSEARGKVGGGVFTKTRSGSVLRRRAIPSNPNTAAQSTVRAYLADIAAEWRSLTGTQRQAWIDAAAAITRTQSVSGQSYHPTGFNYFVELNTKLSQASGATTFVATPPAGTWTPGSIGVTTATGGNDLITWDAATANAADEITELLGYRKPSAGVACRVENLRHLEFFDFTGSPPATHDTTGLTAGEWCVGYRVVNTTTGEMGPITMLDSVTVT